MNRVIAHLTKPSQRLFLAALIIAVGYIVLFVQSIAPYWFNPRFTTDDALQQVYQFHRAVHPELFTEDFPTTLMERYLTPIHYWIGIGITKMTKEPVMTAHWMTLIQLVCSWAAMYLLICGTTCSRTAGLIGATWLLHSRPVIQRLTGGLVRGWALPIFCLYLWAVTTRRYRWCLGILFIGAFLHPPATFLCAATHGLYLGWSGFIRPFILGRASELGPTPKTLLTFLIFTPLLAIATLLVTQMPEQIGSMVTLERAAQTPEMIRPHGRFAFYPLEGIASEVRAFCYQVFLSRFYDATPLARDLIPIVVILLLFAIIVHDLARREARLVPTPLWFFGVAAAVVYVLSRELAFLLYVPNRHLQLPAAVFFIAVFTTAVSRLWHSDAFAGEQPRSLFSSSKTWAVSLSVVLLGCVWCGSGMGLDRDANFNFTTDRRGGVFAWARKSTDLKSVFAGDPTLIDPMPLVGARAVYISTETAHPFYDRYLTETRRRLELSLQGQYGASLQPLLTLLDEGVDYFVFDRLKYRNLALATYNPPLDSLVRDLTSSTQHIFYDLRTAGLTDRILVPYADQRALVVNLHELKRRGGKISASPEEVTAAPVRGQ